MTGGTATVKGFGDMDLRIAPTYSQQLREAVSTGREVVADLREASYIDTAMLVALIAPARTLLREGRRLKVLVAASGQPEYALRTVGFGDLLEICAE